MSLQLVASNPHQPRSSERERVLRGLRFIDADLLYKIARTRDPAKIARYGELRGKVAAAMLMLSTQAKELQP